MRRTIRTDRAYVGSEPWVVRAKGGTAREVVDALAGGAGEGSPGEVVLTETFVISGSPVPKGRPRFDPRSGRAFTPKRTADYEKHGAACLHAQLLAKRLIDSWPKDARYVVYLDFYFKGPRWCDVDNAAKACFDLANGILWDDDIRCDIGHARRHQDSNNPRTVIRVEVVR